MAVAFAVVAAVVIGGIAYASIPDGNAVIHGCYATRDGALRVIDTSAGESCTKKETPLDWNQTGPTGATGSTGVTGPAGPFPTTLPSGKTLTGDYRTSRSTDGDYADDTQSFAFPLSSSPAVHFIGIGATPPAECPGSFSNPQASPGNLCVYAALGETSPTAVFIVDPESNIGPGASPRGFTVVMDAAPDSFSTGSWAVTAA
jgi:hypothetical protein